MATTLRKQLEIPCGVATPLAFILSRASLPPRIWLNDRNQSFSPSSTAGAFRAETKGNAIALARKPNYDRLLAEFPNTLIHTSGPFVGLPEGQMGNSEVGHLNIGAGRIVQMDITRIDPLIASGEFFRQPLLLEAMERGREHQLHLIGLVSDGGVHSHIEHLFALLRMARENKVERVFVHCFMDGRDTPPNSGIDFLRQLEQKMREFGVGQIASCQRPLLRHGSRQSLGAHRESLSRDGARRRGSKIRRSHCGRSRKL